MVADIVGTGLAADVYVGYILKACPGRIRWTKSSDLDWDESNAQKNWERHGVTPEEAEEIFFREPLVVRADLRHGKDEKRYYALGQTNSGRLLFAAFTIRRKLIPSYLDQGHGSE